MQPLSQQSTPRLRKRVELLEKFFAETHPEEWREYLLTKEIVEKRSDPNGPYFRIRTPTPAIRMVLTEAGTALTKQQIFDKLEQGGFPMDSYAKKGLVNDAIAYLLEKGELVSIGEGKRREQLLAFSNQQKVATE